MSVALDDTKPSYRDPLDIERLADDLALRHTHSNGRTSDDDEDGELPEDIPLSHKDKYLTADVFDVEEFLLSRSRTSLPDLRTELRTYLAELKEELVQLINDDYEAFISLSTDLRDEGARLERLKHPLGGIKAKVIESKQELQAIQDEIHDKLAKRNRLREEKALLHLLLKISESITRLESLLLITPPETTTAQPIELKSRFVMLPGGSSDNSDDRFRGSKAKHLSRVSAEYTQLLYHVKKARTENCEFVNEVQWRIDRLRSTLSSDLDHLFASTLTGLTDTKAESRLSDLERSKLMTDLTECLRTYDMLGLWRDAEDVFRREVVRAFVKKTIHPGGLTAPHSPIVPNTPFHFSGAGPLTTTSGTPHQIPYTPFTAFIPKQPSFRLSSADVPQAHLLDDADDSLAKLYNQLLRFVERDACAIMSAAEKVSGKDTNLTKISTSTSLDGVGASPTTGADDHHREQEGSPKFDIMANVIWDELGRTIMDEIGSIVFASGKPNEFRKHYETTQGFIRSLELLAPSMEAVDSMRRHPTYVAFERRWQLPVYFQLRWKEIVGALEDMFAVGYLDPITPKDGSFSMPQSSATWIAISACWSSDIFIPELSHRFWRLTLQILSRYAGWLSKIVSSADSSSNSKSHPTTQQDKSSAPTRAATPDVPVESTAADDALLRQYAAALIDIRILEKNVLNLWSQVISVMLQDDDAQDESRIEDALRESLSSSTALIAPLSSNIVAILTKRCCEGLLPVRNIPAQFRAMSNKRMPTEPSYFIPSILRPVKQFFAIGTQDGAGNLLRDQFLAEYATEVFDNVAQRYISYLTAMKKMEVSLKRMVRTPFSLFGGSSNTRDEGKDEERIRCQMILDVEAFGKDAESLQVKINTNTHFLSLKEIVYATDQE